MTSLCLLHFSPLAASYLFNNKQIYFLFHISASIGKLQVTMTEVQFKYTEGRFCCRRDCRLFRLLDYDDTLLWTAPVF